MAVITIDYDARNKMARAIVRLMEDSGLFSILKDDEPNETTKQAIRDAEAGKTYKAKNFADMVRYLKS
jgi:hypothetical protein